MWVAKNKRNKVILFGQKPIYNNMDDVWFSGTIGSEVRDDLFPNLTFEESPIQLCEIDGNEIVNREVSLKIETQILEKEKIVEVPVEKIVEKEVEMKFNSFYEMYNHYKEWMDEHKQDWDTRCFKNFEHLYSVYKDIIEKEFYARHQKRCKNIKDVINSQIKLYKGDLTSYGKRCINTLEKIMELINKELTLSLPFDSITDNFIRHHKNLIVDRLYSDRHRGDRNALIEASFLANLFEKCMYQCLFNDYEHLKTDEEMIEIANKESQLPTV